MIDFTTSCLLQDMCDMIYLSQHKCLDFYVTSMCSCLKKTFNFCMFFTFANIFFSFGRACEGKSIAIVDLAQYQHSRIFGLLSGSLNLHGSVLLSIFSGLENL